MPPTTLRSIATPRPEATRRRGTRTAGRGRRAALFLALALALTATAGRAADRAGMGEKAAEAVAADRAGSGGPSTAGTGAMPPDVGWARHGRTPLEDRFSPLDQIDRHNVDGLGPAWVFATGSHRGQEATPLVVDGVLYTTSTWSVVYALDAKTGALLWRHDPQVPRWKGRHACCDVVNRGVAHRAGRIFLGTLDGRLQALDARTGAVVWSVRTTELAEPYTITGAPRVVGDLVVIGNGGAEFGVRGYFSAYHAETGEMAWRFHTVPASKDGPHERPALARAAATWSADSLFESGLGGTAWDAMAWDPALDLLYVGTGNASVYDREKRSPGGGDNLYVSSILAVRPKTGELVWHYQTTPGDHWDYTSTQHMILADLDWQGERRKVLMQAPKNGFFYVLDRETGELLSAEKFVHTSWASRVDLTTGRPVERPEAHWSTTPRMVAPAPPGAHNWHPMSFHPGTGLVYLPVSEMIYFYVPDPDFAHTPGRWNTAEDLAAVHEELENYPDARFAPCGQNRLVAWDPVRGEKVWERLRKRSLPAGLLSTAGNLVFQGHDGGRFSAFDAANGRVRWSVDVGVDIIAAPITYRVDGEQYVAVMTGAGGSHGSHATQLDHRNPGYVLAFKLGGEAELPDVPPRAPGRPQVPRADVAPAVIDQGRRAYAELCFSCHGMGVVSSGLYPDLRHASPGVHARWDAIVRGGLRTPDGMPSFADQLSADEAEAIRAYVLERAWHEPGLLERAVSLFVEHACVPTGWVTD